jgi:ATP phosphoribosyltransferase regulatory subunit
MGRLFVYSWKEKTMNQIRIPQGMRDLISEECEKKEALKTRIEKVFASYGYRPLKTPAIEYLETYANGYGDMADEEMYKFFDQEGRTLVLRADMTVPIARMCASKFSNAMPPFRFRYCSDVFKVRHTFAGQRSEVTDCGIELIGCDSRSDLEVLCTALDTMQAIGAKEYVLEIGNSEFFRNACHATHLSEEAGRRLAQLIDRKSMVELQEYLKTLSLDEKSRNFFRQLPMLGGGQEALLQAEQISFTDSLKDEVQTLKDLYADLQSLGYGSQIRFDFGKVPHLDYYTGIIFEGYVGNVGTSVLSGGRYDSLLKKFGRDLPACGFSVKLDSLIDILPEEKTDITKLYYERGKEAEALKQAKQLRQKGAVELVEKVREEKA